MLRSRRDLQETVDSCTRDLGRLGTSDFLISTESSFMVVDKSALRDALQKQHATRCPFYMVGDTMLSLNGLMDAADEIGVGADVISHLHLKHRINELDHPLGLELDEYYRTFWTERGLKLYEEGKDVGKAYMDLWLERLADDERYDFNVPQQANPDRSNAMCNFGKFFHRVPLVLTTLGRRPSYDGPGRADQKMLCLSLNDEGTSDLDMYVTSKDLSLRNCSYICILLTAQEHENGVWYDDNLGVVFYVEPHGSCPTRPYTYSGHEQVKRYSDLIVRGISRLGPDHGYRDCDVLDRCIQAFSRPSSWMYLNHSQLSSCPRGIQDMLLEDAGYCVSIVALTFFTLFNNQGRLQDVDSYYDTMDALTTLLIRCGQADEYISAFSYGLSTLTDDQESVMFSVQWSQDEEPRTNGRRGAVDHGRSIVLHEE